MTGSEYTECVEEAKEAEGESEARRGNCGEDSCALSAWALMMREPEADAF